MAFKKIDADAVNAGEPLDAFVLQGVAANLDAARTNRLRRNSIPWPVDAEKTVAAHKTVALGLAYRPIPLGVTEVSIDVMHDIADANVNMALAVETPAGLDKDDTDLTSIGTGTNTVTTLACDVSAFQGRLARLYLLVKSDIATSPAQQEVTIAGATDGNIIETPSKLRLPSGHGITLFGNTGDRWTLYFDEAASGSLLAEGDSLPGPRTVIKMADPSGDTELAVWPRFAPEDVESLLNWSQGNYKVVVDTLGRTTIKSIAVYDSAVTAFPDMTGQLLPGRPLPGRVGSDLYLRGRFIHAQHTRMYHSGPTYDRSRQDSNSDELSMWGEIVEYSSTTRAPVAAVWVGDYPQNNLNGGAARRKSRIRVAGKLVVVSNFREPIAPVAELSIRASIFSFGGGGTWGTSETNGTAVQVHAPIVGNGGNDYGVETNESAPLFMFGSRGVGGQSWHYLRGCVGADDLNQTGAGIVTFECEVEDDQTGAADRMLRVEVLGLVTTTDTVWASYPPLIHCLNVTVWEAEGTEAT